jgi:hypothetical protein
MKQGMYHRAPRAMSEQKNGKGGVTLKNVTPMGRTR